jgi:hypothetical protein
LTGGTVAWVKAAVRVIAIGCPGSHFGSQFLDDLYS